MSAFSIPRPPLRPSPCSILLLMLPLTGGGGGVGGCNARHVCLFASREAVRKRSDSRTWWGNMQQQAFRKYTVKKPPKNGYECTSAGAAACTCGFSVVCCVTADPTEEDEQLPHSASAATQLILSLPRFKGTLSCFKDLFKALILIGRGLFCHIKRVGGGDRRCWGG